MRDIGRHPRASLRPEKTRDARTALLATVEDTMRGFCAEVAHNLGMHITFDTDIAQAVVEELFGTERMRDIVIRYWNEREYANSLPPDDDE